MAIIVHGKGNKERRIALGRNALRSLVLYTDFREPVKGKPRAGRGMKPQLER